MTNDRHELEQALRAIEDAWRKPGFEQKEVETRIGNALYRRSLRAHRCLNMAWRALDSFPTKQPTYTTMLSKFAFLELERASLHDELMALKCQAVLNTLFSFFTR